MFSNNTLTESMIIKKYDDHRAKTIDFAKKILELELQIKEIKTEISEIKKDAKIDGVFVSGINKVLSEMKKIRKTSDEEKKEFKELLDFFEEQPEIVNLVEKLIQKNED